MLSSAGLFAWLCGVTNTACLLLISVSIYFAFLLNGVPTANAGHRVGGHGFDGPRPENTLEALRDLIRRDNAAPLGDLSYAEFDVHVSNVTSSSWPVPALQETLCSVVEMHMDADTHRLTRMPQSCLHSSTRL